MNNLKRVLALVLSVIMIIGMMAVSASAASADFDDAAEITKTEAVNTLVALNVIKGKDDGSFHPTDDVTRGEMAKMIYVVMNNGKDNPNLTTKEKPTFTDIEGHWAEGYIEYCYSTGIISGRGDGTFDPNANVTAQEAAKMVLIALGYSEKEEELTGPDWALHTNIIALQNDLYDDVDPLPAADVDRDNAAQIIYNAGNSYIITKYENSLTTDANGNVKTVGTAVQSTDTTLFAKKFGLDYKTTFVTGISLKDGTYTYTLDKGVDDKLGGDTGNYAGTSYKTADDYTNLFGHRVQVLYKPGTTTDKDAIYGLKDLGTVVAEGAYADITSANKKDAYAYNDSDLTKLEDTTAPKDYYNYQAIDNSGNGKADVVIVTPVTISSVTFVGSSSITTAAGAFKFDEADIYDGVAKGDAVVITKAANTADGVAVVAKAETVEGDIAAVQDTKLRIGSTWYSRSSAATDPDSATVGNTVALTLVNGLVVDIAVKAGDTAAVTLDDVLYVAKSSGTDNAASATNLDDSAKGDDTLVYFRDGTSATVKAMRVDTYTADDEETVANIVPAAGLYTYKVNEKTGIYELKAVKDEDSTNTTVGSTFYVAKAANLPGDAYVTSFTDGNTEGTDDLFDTETDKLDGVLVDDDAFVVIVDTNSKINVITGKDLKAKKSFGLAANAVAVTKQVSGLTNVELLYVTTGAAYAALTDTSSADEETGYGYVTAAGVAELNDDGDVVIKFSAWTGSKVEELTAVDDSLAAGNETNAEYAKGAFVSFKTTDTEGEVNTVTAIDDFAAITGWDGSKNIAFDGSSSTLAFKDKDATVVIYVDTANGTGVEGGSIALATEIASGVYTKNAVYAAADGELVDVLFVDVANNMKDAPYDIATLTEPTIASAVNGISKVEDGTTKTATSAKAGASVNLSLKVTGTLESGTKVKITATFTTEDTETFTEDITLEATPSGDVLIPFTMPGQNITSITLAVTDATPAAG